jgi:hypothetical protein
MTVTAETDADFVFEGLPAVQEAHAVQAQAQPADPLGPLAALAGTWKGHGFNTIWRPHPLAGGGQDRFLELNLTTETLAFTKINGAIPNRGLLMANTDFNSVAATFTELDLSTPTSFRFASPGVTQNMVKNPNSVLQAALQASLAGTTMKTRTFLHVSTTQNPIKGGGGTANTAFLAAGSNPPGGNAKAVEIDATFWIETIAGTGGNPDTHQLQYTQLVQLDFNGIRWPHVTVATLLKQ